jgi:hypothetical protein
VVHLITLLRRNLHRYWCIALSFESGYAVRSVNYAKKVMKLLHWGSSHNLFWRNLHRHIALCFDSGYASRSVNYAEKVL